MFRDLNDVRESGSPSDVTGSRLALDSALGFVHEALFRRGDSSSVWMEVVGAALGRALGTKVTLEVMRDDFSAPARPVLTSLEVEAHHPHSEPDSLLSRFRQTARDGDGIALLAYPEPGTILVALAVYPQRISLAARDRRLLAQLALHLESAHRIVRRPKAVIGSITNDGQLRPTRALSRGEVWPRITRGELALVPRSHEAGRELTLVETAPELRSFRALADEENDVVLRAARGVPTKTIAVDLRLTPSAVSKRLEAAAHKVGVASRTDLVRICSALTGASDDHARSRAAVLTVES